MHLYIFKGDKKNLIVFDSENRKMNMIIQILNLVKNNYESFRISILPEYCELLMRKFQINF